MLISTLQRPSMLRLPFDSKGYDVNTPILRSGLGLLSPRYI